MKIVAYTLHGCSSCNQLKELFSRAQVEYTEVIVRENLTVEEFQQLYPTISYFPFVVIDDEPVGNLIDTAKLFVSKGLVSSKK